MPSDQVTDLYQEFLASKAATHDLVGLDVIPPLSGGLFPFQASTVEFLLKVGRGAAFLDTGLGKTIIQLEWARVVSDQEKRPVLILAPLAVADQTVREAEKFGIDASVIGGQEDVIPGINVTNYEKLHRFDPSSFVGVVLDESSILKSFTGKTTRFLIETFSQTPYRIACTATPAPNDHMELGTHAEFLGVMNSNEMLSRFFINDTSQASQKWRLKGHAETTFWDWMAAWSRMAQEPADLGDCDTKFDLPPMEIIRHQARSSKVETDNLFAFDTSVTKIHGLKRQTTDARSDAVASLVNASDDFWVVWCDTDYESAALTKRIPDAVEVKGSQPSPVKEKGLLDFSLGHRRVIISKPSLAGFGLNWQHCANVAFVGRSFSYEAWYQAVRRCWRFGQKRPVNVHIVVAEGEAQIGRVITRKSADHDKMKSAMADAMRRANGREHRRKIEYSATHKGRLPAWLK